MTEHHLSSAPLLVAALVVLLVLGAVTVFLHGRTRRPLGIRPKLLLTDNERSFLLTLQRALPSQCVFPQVSFAAFLTHDPQLSPKARLALRAKFNRKIADFVCDRETLQISAIIELDDRTHVATADRQRDELTAAAGYRTIRFQSKQKPTEAEIVALFQSAPKQPVSRSYRPARSVSSDI